jgi:DNA-directed RNA polymerase subunit omega
MIMNNAYLSQALRNVKNPNILVNMVSQRVRQLGQGHKALVATDARMSYMDIALKEIADGKIEFEMADPSSFEDQEKKQRKKK